MESRKMGSSFRLRRSILWASGPRRREIAMQAVEVGADAIRCDLEDLVPPERKEIEREEVIEFLRTTDFGRMERWVRVNNPFEPWGRDDLRRIPVAHPDGVSVPKLKGAAEIRQADEWLSEGEEAAGLPIGSIELMPLFETPWSILNAKEIMSASPRVKSYNFGIYDFATDMRATVTPDNREMLYAKQHCLIVARALGCMAIEGTAGNLRNIAELEMSTRLAKEFGYDGRSCLDISMVEVVNRIFSPSTEEIDKALEFVEAFRKQRETGSMLACGRDGVVLGPPVFKRYERVLAMAEALGLISPRGT